MEPAASGDTSIDHQADAAAVRRLQRIHASALRATGRRDDRLIVMVFAGASDVAA